jgi:hypothetical protein
LTKKENASLSQLLIPRAAKEQIRRQLFLLGIDEHTIYGDLESLAKRLCFAFGIVGGPRKRPL